MQLVYLQSSSRLLSDSGCPAILGALRRAPLPCQLRCGPGHCRTAVPCGRLGGMRQTTALDLLTHSARAKQKLDPRLGQPPSKAKAVSVATTSFQPSSHRIDHPCTHDDNNGPIECRWSVPRPCICLALPSIDRCLCVSLRCVPVTHSPPHKNVSSPFVSDLEPSICTGAPVNRSAHRFSALSRRWPETCLTSNATLRQNATRRVSETSLLPLSPPSPSLIAAWFSHERACPRMDIGPGSSSVGERQSGQIGPARSLTAQSKLHFTAQSTH